MALVFSEKEFEASLKRYLVRELEKRSFADLYFELFPEDVPRCKRCGQIADHHHAEDLPKIPAKTPTEGHALASGYGYAHLNPPVMIQPEAGTENKCPWCGLPLWLGPVDE